MLGLPEAINLLPVTQTIQYPASSHNGNWQVLENLLKQGGVPDARLEDDIILVHGDLATKERIDGLRKMCTIESDSKGRLAFVIFVPGLFHLKMAATDAYRRAHVQPCEGREDAAGFFDYVRHLRPKETGKFINGPGFCRLHDSIHHATWLDILDCFRLESRGFALSERTWESIIEISEAIIHRYMPGDNFGDVREQENSARDMVFENASLRKQHGLLYLELSHAMNHGDVGRILRVLPYWIVVFKSTGKIKYMAHMIWFITDLDHVYLKRLKDLLLHNWLCNPTGKADGWRGWDWLQERNNLYTKVIFAGYGSNHTQQLIMSRSILIKVHQSAHQIIENNFYLTHHTIRHSSPKMTRTLGHLSGYIADTNRNPHIFMITDLVTMGFAMLSEDADLCGGDVSIEDTGTVVITASDIGIN
ncbi:hypothetical protein L208DRAFT_1424421 [Tricholoma matsutake]|nr:hypothetical protein L208DRAFT_1424421 [Tricholoma matsutake 945]